MQQGTIVYFGTNGPNSGHHADVIYGSCDSFAERVAVAEKCDRFSEIRDVQIACTNAHFFRYADVNGTYFGCLKSPDDIRPGSKTMVFVYGKHISVDEMIDIIKQYPLLRYRFMAVCRKYGWDNIFE